jgi:hypothetical protein
MYCNSDFGFLNSFNNACVIYAKVLVWPSIVVLWSFMYHTRICPLKVVSNYVIFVLSSWMFLAVHMVSHTNMCCYGYLDPIPFKSSNLSVLSTPTMLLGVGPLPGDVG